MVNLGGAGFDPMTPPQQTFKLNQRTQTTFLFISPVKLYVNLHSFERPNGGGRILQEEPNFTLSEFDKFYMVSTLLDATNTMALSVYPSEFYIFWPFFSMEV